MNEKTTQKSLTSAGLNDKEAEVYLTALRLGPTSVLEIARHSSLKRSTIYGIIESLHQKGLMRIEMAGLKTLFAAEHPRNLERLILRQKEELDHCLPDLEDLYGEHETKNFIRFYEGQESIKTAYDNLLRRLKPSDDYLVFGDLQSWHDSDPAFFEKWPEKRKKIMRQGRSIFADSPLARQYKDRERHLDTQVKLLSPKTKLSAIKVITSEFIFIHKTKRPFVVFVIESKSVVAMYKEMFEALWEMIE